MCPAPQALACGVCHSCAPAGSPEHLEWLTCSRFIVSLRGDTTVSGEWASFVTELPAPGPAAAPLVRRARMRGVCVLIPLRRRRSKSLFLTGSSLTPSSCPSRGRPQLRRIRGPVASGRWLWRCAISRRSRGRRRMYRARQGRRVGAARSPRARARGAAVRRCHVGASRVDGRAPACAVVSACVRV